MKSVAFEGGEEDDGFSILPNVILKNTKLSVNARFLLLAMRMYAWQEESCWPGQASLAALMNMSERNLRTYIKELCEAGLLRVEKRGLGATNRYILLTGDRKPTSGLDRNSTSSLDRKPTSYKEDTVEKDSINKVFKFWQLTMKKPRAKLDNSRRSKISARLRDGYTVEQLRDAIAGCALSEWHMGNNPNSRAYNDITLICRDAEKVEGFMQVKSESNGPSFDWKKLGVS